MNTVERILNLIAERGITAKKLTVEATLNHNAITAWKKGIANPSHDAIVKIAQYFNVSTDYLLGISDNPTPPGVDKDDELWELRQEMAERSEMKTLFDLSKDATKEDIEFVNDMLKKFKGGGSGE